MSNDWKAEEIKRRYAPTPDEPRHRKKARKRHVRSDHKHEYERVAIDTHTSEVDKTGRHKVYHVGVRCKVCGKLHNVMMWAKREPEDGMRLFEVDDIFKLLVAKELPEEWEVRR